MTYTTLNTRLDLVQTTESALSKNAYTAGSLYFTTDSNKLYADLDNKRHCFSGIIFRNSYAELNALANKITQTLYWDLSTNICYTYNGTTLVKVLSADNIESMSLEVVDSIDSVTDPLASKLYAVASTDTMANNTHNLYAYVNGDFIQITPTKSSFQAVSDNRIELSLSALERELNALRDDIDLAAAQEPSEYFEQIESFYTNVYSKSETFTKTEVQELFNNGASTIKNELKTTQPLVAKLITSTNGTVVLQPNVSFYEYDLAKGTTVTIDKTNITNLQGVATFELHLKSAKGKTISYNPNPVWVDGVKPSSYNNIIVGFRSFDNGINWVASYQGGWD